MKNAYLHCIAIGEACPCYLEMHPIECEGISAYNCSVHRYLNIGIDNRGWVEPGDCIEYIDADDRCRRVNNGIHRWISIIEYGWLDVHLEIAGNDVCHTAGVILRTDKGECHPGAICPRDRGDEMEFGGTPGELWVGCCVVCPVHLKNDARLDDGSHPRCNVYYYVLIFTGGYSAAGVGTNHLRHGWRPLTVGNVEAVVYRVAVDIRRCGRHIDVNAGVCSHTVAVQLKTPGGAPDRWVETEWVLRGTQVSRVCILRINSRDERQAARIIGYRRLNIVSHLVIEGPEGRICVADEERNIDGIWRQLPAASAVYHYRVEVQLKFTLACYVCTETVVCRLSNRPTRGNGHGIPPQENRGITVCAEGRCIVPDNTIISRPRTEANSIRHRRLGAQYIALCNHTREVVALPGSPVGRYIGGKELLLVVLEAVVC